MTEQEKFKQAAPQWVDDWNNRNLEKVPIYSYLSANVFRMNPDSGIQETIILLQYISRSKFPLHLLLHNSSGIN